MDVTVSADREHLLLLLLLLLRIEPQSLLIIRVPTLWARRIHHCSILSPRILYQHFDVSNYSHKSSKQYLDVTFVGSKTDCEMEQRARHRCHFTPHCSSAHISAHLIALIRQCALQDKQATAYITWLTSG